MSEVTQNTLPQHVAIIMDGNGRWASARGKMRAMGHKAGMEAVRRTLDAAAKYGVKYLTLYSFSTENWQRPEEEVGELMGLLRLYLQKELASLHERGVQLRVIGERTRLPEDIQKLIAHAEGLTKKNETHVLQIALSYGGRQEIVAATRAIAEKVAKGALDAAAIDDAVFAQHLFTDGVPDPDLVIRTSGEQRLSNFLLWQAAYAEFYFTPVLWPDFDESEFVRALDAFGQRERRYGAVHG